MTENQRHLLRSLRLRRRQLGLKQREIASLSGYTESQINRWENAREFPRGSALLDWCEALGVRLTVHVVRHIERPKAA